MSRQSFIPTLRKGVYVISLFLVLALFISWKETKTEGESNAARIQLARAKGDFILCFITLLLAQLMPRYFSVMSEMRRLEKSDIAMKNQANQASKLAHAMMEENDNLRKRNKKLAESDLNKKEEPPSP